jgi:hypothetical protein
MVAIYINLIKKEAIMPGADELSQMWYSKQAILAKITDFLPKLLLAIIILFLGWIIAKVLRAAAVRLFKLLRIHEAAEKAGIEAFLSKGGIGFTMTSLLGQIVYWFIIFITLLFAIDVLGLPTVENILDKVVNYIPDVFVAVVLIIFGTLLGRFVQSTLSAYFRNIGMANGEVVATTAHYIILIFVIIAAFEQLHIGGTILPASLQIILAGFALAFGIAFGWGAKDVAKDIAERMYRHFK